MDYEFDVIVEFIISSFEVKEMQDLVGSSDVYANFHRGTNISCEVKILGSVLLILL